MEIKKKSVKIPDLAKKFEVSEMTVRRIQSKKEDLVKCLDEFQQPRGSLERNIVKQSKLTDALYTLFKQARANNEICTDATLKEMGLTFNTCLKEIPNFKASNE